jgi:hypothetical protein
MWGDDGPEVGIGRRHPHNGELELKFHPADPDHLARGEGHADQGRKGLRACLPHDMRTMVIDGALADAEVSSNVLACIARKDKVLHVDQKASFAAWTVGV